MTPPLFRAPAGTSAGVVTLDGAEGHHAADVLRLRIGEPAWLTDGAGTRWSGRVVAVRRGELDLALEPPTQVPPPRPRFVVVQALAKGGRDEAAVEAMTEVGVDEFVGWQAARSIAKWTTRTEARWRDAAAAAAKQSRRAWWPEVTGPLSTTDVAQLLGRAALPLVLHESATDALVDCELPTVGDVVVVVGPEGGIAEEEVAQLSAAGGRPVRLGATVLRSSTAGPAAIAALSGRSRWR